MRHKWIKVEKEPWKCRLCHVPQASAKAADPCIKKSDHYKPRHLIKMEKLRS